MSDEILKEDWRLLLDPTEQKILAGAEAFAADQYPDPGANLKKLLAKLARLMDRVANND